MTKFDFIVLGLLAISAAVGFFRGATREIVALVALVAAILAAVFGLPFAGPLVRDVIRPGWLGTTAALVLVFLVVYVVLRLIGAAIARQAQRARMLGTLDRSIGLAIGLGRGLVALGVLNLMFNAATPADLKPRWITNAMTWPTAQNMGRAVAAVAPKGLDLAGRLKPSFGAALQEGSRDRSATDGYEADDLAEKSR